MTPPPDNDIMPGKTAKEISRVKIANGAKKKGKSKFTNKTKNHVSGISKYPKYLWD